MKSSIAVLLSPLVERCFECRPRGATHRDPVRRGGIRPLPGPRNWYDRGSQDTVTVYGHFESPREPSTPHRLATPRGSPAADLREHPAGDPRRDREPGRATSFVAGARRRSRGLPHHHAARGPAAPGRGVPHRAAWLGDVGGGG